MKSLCPGSFYSSTEGRVYGNIYETSTIGVGLNPRDLVIQFLCNLPSSQSYLKCYAPASTEMYKENL